MNKNSEKYNEDLKIIPYTATSLSVVGRFIFMFLTSNQVFDLWRCKGCFKINIQIMYHNNQTRRKENILNKPPHIVLYCIVLYQVYITDII